MFGPGIILNGGIISSQRGIPKFRISIDKFIVLNSLSNTTLKKLKHICKYLFKIDKI